MTTIQLQREGEVFVLHMRGGENKLTTPFVEELDLTLTEVEKSNTPSALVVTSEGKHWSTGIDLEWLTQQAPEDSKAFVQRLEGLMARLLLFPRPTVAAVNGHVVAGGALLALAHDYRVMRADRGWLSLPEIDIGIPFRPGMLELLRAKLTPASFRDAVLTGARFGGQDAQAAGLVDDAVAQDQVLPKAVERAAGLASKDAKMLGQFKREMYGSVAERLRGG